MTISLSKLIKGGSGGKSGEKVIAIRYISTPSPNKHEPPTPDFTKELEKAQKRAEQILEQAKERALQIEREVETEKRNLEEEKRRIYNTAEEEGYRAGFSQGEKRGYQEAESYIQLAKQTVADAKKQFDQTVERSEHMILSIALKVAEKIVKTALPENEGMYISFVKNAIQEAKQFKEVQVYVHPKYYSLLVDRQEELFSNLPQASQVFIYPKEELDETACVIETEGGLIDASIDSQFRELSDQLFEILSGVER